VLEASLADPERRAIGGTHDFVKLREIRTLLSSGALGTLIDAPFLPAFIAVLYFIHPWYGSIALFGGLTL
jgi:ATP-binding cassette subfamily C protein